MSSDYQISDSHPLCWHKEGPLPALIKKKLRSVTGGKWLFLARITFQHEWKSIFFLPLLHNMYYLIFTVVPLEL